MNFATATKCLVENVDFHASFQLMRMGHTGSNIIKSSNDHNHPAKGSGRETGVVPGKVEPLVGKEIVMDWNVEIVGDQIYVENEISFEHIFLSRSEAFELRDVLSEGLKMLPVSCPSND